MLFHGDGLPITTAGLDHGCRTLGVGPAELWTVLAIETDGFGFLPDRRPHLRFERHVFHAVTKGTFDVSHPDISNAIPGGYAGGAAEYPRLEVAVKLDYESALDSAFWGIGQILGFNCERAGSEYVGDMVADMIRDEDSQLQAVVTYIINSGLAPALQRRDWEAFAAGYNGPASREKDYVSRLAAANAKYHAALPDLTLRLAQVALLYIGIDPGPIDGVQGPRTRAAVRTFQAQQQLPITGTLDPLTDARLLAAAFPEEWPL